MALYGVESGTLFWHVKDVNERDTCYLSQFFRSNTMTYRCVTDVKVISEPFSGILIPKIWQ